MSESECECMRPLEPPLFKSSDSCLVLYALVGLRLQAERCRVLKSLFFQRLFMLNHVQSYTQIQSKGGLHTGLDGFVPPF